MPICLFTARQRERGLRCLYMQGGGGGGGDEGQIRGGKITIGLCLREGVWSQG